MKVCHFRHFKVPLLGINCNVIIIAIHVIFDTLNFFTENSNPDHDGRNAAGIFGEKWVGLPAKSVYQFGDAKNSTEGFFLEVKNVKSNMDSRNQRIVPSEFEFESQQKKLHIWHFCQYLSDTFPVQKPQPMFLVFADLLNDENIRLRTSWRMSKVLFGQKLGSNIKGSRNFTN